jgi:tRNA-Thr(GGU) m(6)t(6)A37 methyltransferase TsaA
MMMSSRSGKEIEDNNMIIHFHAIGHVENEFNTPARPEQIRMGESRIVLNPSLQMGLNGLKVGDQIMVIFYFHLSKGFDLLQHPHGDQSQPKRGVFALHTPFRPNPIGVTTVDLLSIEKNILIVKGLDAINGSPILDLKSVHKKE